ncbi:hybrid sensor histidine kinase/response regulator [Burkholderia sp. Ac-20392]|uniref:hybrid sensor histidine kinase/response regulator n=1 Tax=Burkholderia sp. Ac-20392 TaxID=2703905 RepID=UPI001980568C|nr:hybrid sensor histidine kinase/response regulator [Burkholderia sp. Ac-20392]MBN3794122.1 response regulator [Burkholderia sp. Ac-20392]
MPILRQTLDELLRYHRLLMGGGRWAAAAVVVLALFAEVAVLVRGYMTDERQRFAVAHRLVRGRVAANEQAFLSGLVRAELSSGDERPVPHSLVERFRVNGNLLNWKPFPAEKLKLMIAAAPDASIDDATVARYFQCATQISRSNIAAAKVLGRQPTQSFSSLDRQIFAIMPASAIVDPERLSSDAGRNAFMKELTSGIGQLADAAPASSNGRLPKASWSPHPYLLPQGQSTLTLAAKVSEGDCAGTILVTEVDPGDLIWPLVGGEYGGVYAIVDADGDIAATAAHYGPGGPLRDLLTRWRRSEHPDPDTLLQQPYDGRMVLAQQLGDTGYTLVYTYSWHDVLAAIRNRTLATAFVLAVILAVIWLLLFLLDRRVFLPMYARSERVFESERLSRTVIETVPVGIGLVSIGTGELLHGGSSLVALAEQIDGGMGRLLAELATRYARRLAAYRDAAAELVFVEDVTLPTCDDGEIALQARFAVGRYLGDDVLIAAFVDMSASQRLARQLRDSKRASDQANAAKSAFLATMSHEIRTPLNAILGNLELFAHSPLSPLQRDRLQSIRASSNGLLAIIQDVLDFSKIEAGEMQLEHIPFNVADVATRALMMFAPVAQAKGIVLYGAFGASIDESMRGDPVRISQIVHNLLSNAIKFTNEGKVVLSVGTHAPDYDTAADGMLIVEVADTGIGIDVTQRENLFDAFVQADSSITRRFGGTGLGLALCQRLTREMGGTIGVDGEKGKGSRFTVRLPLDRVTPANGRMMTDARPFAGARLVFVAGADEWHAYAVPLLSAWGAEVSTAHHPDVVRSDSGRVLILCGDRSAWSADSENRLVEEWPVVVHCTVNGPQQPLQVGRILTVSCYAPAGLQAALAYALNGVPLAPLDSPANRGGTDDADSMPRLGLHVLVAEDNEVNQQLIVEQLSMLDCTATVAADGVDALQILSDTSFDIVLTDLNMPRLDGYVLAEIMRERWPHTPLVAVTADATADERRRCAELGIRAVVSKPLSLGSLARVLSRTIEWNGGQPAFGAASDTLLGDRTMPPEVVDAFHRGCAKSIDALRDALTRGDKRTTLSQLHALKGALGIFQQHELAQYCSDLERRIKSRGFDDSRDALRTLLDRLVALRAEQLRR